MNWLDWLLLGMIAMAAVRGFMRGLVLEMCGLVALVVGIWGGIHLNDRVAVRLGLDPANEAVAWCTCSGTCSPHCSKQRS
jgi:uncharacterized membrane protein required for colicin V production